ncbi:hypothetical protein [Aquabacterium sp. OR-4]|uniref:hypothetical protein n=1 Tax=Aquabacterium sp. OR-4 TaxID=2978127 RepID=UPI0028C955B2|nr:hypothetical protein [Aquabacterium sp. OR-4]MDT7834976.1 hypothetical protein [Aquabacterium sp. OR-4]
MSGDCVFLRRSPRRGHVLGGQGEVVRALLALRDGEELSILTDGSLSMIDILQRLLEVVGPSDVALATWTMGLYDLDACEKFVRDSRIKSMRMIVDPSIFGRRPELSARLVQGFGVKSFRAANIHAKFCILTGGAFSVAVRSSMNLNPNRRIESADIAACADMARFYLGFVDSVFSAVEEGNRLQSAAIFDRLFKTDVKPAARRKGVPSLRSAIRRFG